MGWGTKSTHARHVQCTPREIRSFEGSGLAIIPHVPSKSEEHGRKGGGREKARRSTEAGVTGGKREEEGGRGCR